MKQNCCKICGSSSLTIFTHTAKCDDCGVLLYYPYPDDDAIRAFWDISGSDTSSKRKERQRERTLSWYLKSSFYNHTNFTNMLRFAMDEYYTQENLDVLDYGGGGGQFALVCKSLFPKSTVYIIDIRDDSVLEEWDAVNIQIPFDSFKEDNKKFDFIFLNDVFEHVDDPLLVLQQLSSKLKKDGKIFIDTPKQFWIYPFAKMISRSLYTKILKGTVSLSHLQIWSKKAFKFIVHKSNLKIIKYKEISEYTMPTDYYTRNMGIKNPLLKLAIRIFHKNAKWLANNKIICVLSNRQNQS